MFSSRFSSETLDASSSRPIEQWVLAKLIRAFNVTRSTPAFPLSTIDLSTSIAARVTSDNLLSRLARSSATLRVSRCMLTASPLTSKPMSEAPASTPSAAPVFIPLTGD
jgi:hypothetical protein